MNQLDLFQKFSLLQQTPTVASDRTIEAYRMPTVYHNTTELKGEELRQEQETASNQDEVVLKFFRSSPYQSFTPYQVYFGLGQQFKDSSIKRAITDLTKAGYLIKTNEKRREIYGKMNFCWKLNR